MASRPARARAASCPSDPRVEEPYRLTPQLALRVAILGFVALARLRRPLPAALGAPGALGRQVPRRRRTTTACATLPIDAPRGAILDRNGQRARHATCSGTSLEVWPADLPKSRAARAARAAAARDGRRRPGEGDPSADPRRTPDDPLTPVVVRRGDPRRPDLVPRGAPARSSRASSSPTATCASYPYQSLAAQVLGYVGEISRRRAEGDEAGAATSRAT